MSATHGGLIAAYLSTLTGPFCNASQRKDAHGSTLLGAVLGVDSLGLVALDGLGFPHQPFARAGVLAMLLGTAGIFRSLSGTRSSVGSGDDPPRTPALGLRPARGMAATSSAFVELGHRLVSCTGNRGPHGRGHGQGALRRSSVRRGVAPGPYRRPVGFRNADGVAPAAKGKVPRGEGRR